MTEQGALLTLLLIRLDTDCPQTPVTGQLQMRTNVDTKISMLAHLCE